MPSRSYVLIVDDDAGMCETLSDIISEKGFRVVVADNGAQAIEEVETQPFDFVLIDIMMPEQNGIQTLRQIKVIDPYVTTIVMTGHSAMEGLISEALRAGADGVLYKPFEIETVLDILEWKDKYGSAMPRIDLREYKIQPDALRLITEEVARENGVVPLRVHDEVLSIALSNPENLGAIRKIRRVTGLNIDAFQASAKGVLDAIERGYGSLQKAPLLATAQSASAGATQRDLAGLGGQADGDEESRGEQGEIAALKGTAPESGAAKTGRVLSLHRSASPVRSLRTASMRSPLTGGDSPEVAGSDYGTMQAVMVEGKEDPDDDQPRAWAGAASYFPDSDEMESVTISMTDRESRQMSIARRALNKADTVKKQFKVAEIVEDVQIEIETSAAQSGSEEEDGENPVEQEGATGVQVANTGVQVANTGVQVAKLSSKWPGASKAVVRGNGSVELVDDEPADPANQEAVPTHVRMFKLDEEQTEVVEVARPTDDTVAPLGETEIGVIALSEESSGDASAEEEPTGPTQHVAESGSLEAVEDQLVPTKQQAGFLHNVKYMRRGKTQNVVDAATDEDSIPAMLDSLLALALRDGSSDIHIEPQQDNLRVRYRINGVLHNVRTMPLSSHPLLVSWIKALSSLSIAERHRPQYGQMSISVEGEKMDLRVATSNTAWGEMVVLRVQDKDKPITDLSELGFLPECLARYRTLLESSGGLILVGGPVGSGRTSTLYASIHEFDHDEYKVITIEDPIEYRFDGISQMEVNSRTNTSIASGLQTSMRLDPDIIMVGDIKDKETAKEVVQAALTGHLVLAAIRANDAVDALFRLIDMDIESFLITSALEGVVAQRLARRVCPRCQVLRDAPDEERVAFEWEMGEKREKFVYGEGCDYCTDTGYKGRIGIQEVLVMSEVIRHMLITGAGADKIRAQAMREGMVPMRRDGMMKVDLGMTTPREVLRSMSGLEQREAKFRRFRVTWG